MKLLSNFQFRLETRFKKNPFAVSLSKRTFNDLGGNSPRHSRKNLLTVAAAGVAAATAFTATPASAAFFFICGMFADGGKVLGTIELDDITGNFISLLNTTTTETPGFINPITYTTADFISQSIVLAETNPPIDPPINAFDAYRYIFGQGPNTLQINYATSLFPNNFPAIGDPPGPIMINREFRNGLPRSADDPVIQVPPPVPGPLPILGAAAAFGLSRNIRKRIKSASS
jgi:hypothetical protein